MKTILAILLAASLVPAPYAAAVNARSSPSGPPPIEQPLVREGEFAVELASALNVTSSHDEAAAEHSLISIDITPRNGWISDYPMTPDIIAEVRDSASRSASSGNLQISETDAARIVDKVSIAMNLPVGAAGGKYGYESGSEYVDPSVVEDYYYDNGPPVVTYYPPPWEYAYLYDWVPDPFWWDGLGFGGFFILVDFDRHHHKHHITNHVSNANGTVSRIDATARAGASATANRQTGSMANTANTANASAPQNLTSSGSVRDTDRIMRDPGRGVRDMDRSSSSPRLGTDSTSSSPSNSGRTFNSAPSERFSTSGGYRGGSGGGFRGGGGGGGFHGGGGGGRR